jgi:hypothetical protein
MARRSTGGPGTLAWLLLLGVVGLAGSAGLGLYFGLIPGPAPSEPARVADPAKEARPRSARPGAKPIARPAAETVIVHDEEPGQDPPEASKKDETPVEAPKAPLVLAYEAKARATPDTPPEQRKLALWCEERGLAGEARSHWESVVRLKPDDETARKRLGYRKRGKRWMTPAMIADEQEQEKADKVWFARLSDLHDRMHGVRADATGRRAKAEAELAEVTDPLAAFTLWRVFAGHPQHHLMVARQLGKIASPKSSRMLAAVAAYSADEKARAAAAGELKGRDPVEFAGPLIAMLGPALKFKQVNLPAQPGLPRMKALEVEDERFYHQFVYGAAPAPDSASADAFGGGCSLMVRMMNFGWTAEGRQMASEMNQAEARISQEAADRQLGSDLASVKALNREITARNARVRTTLATATGADFGTDREAWSRWFAGVQGLSYSPPKQAPKVTLAQFVQPMYQPSFIAIPPAPS